MARSETAAIFGDDWQPYGLEPNLRMLSDFAQGCTNRQIAAALVITEGTTSNYVQRVMSRLGVHSRAQIAAWVAERGLQEPASDQDD